MTWDKACKIAVASYSSCLNNTSKYMYVSKFPLLEIPSGSKFKSWHSFWIADISQEQCKIVVVVLHSLKFSHIWPNLIWNFCKCPWSKWLLHWQVYSIVLLKKIHGAFSLQLSLRRQKQWMVPTTWKGCLRISFSFLIEKRGFSIFKIAQYRNVIDDWLITKRNWGELVESCSQSFPWCLHNNSP